ncbi:DUF7275 domain-containing protein, partial [Pseudomonas fluorescens]|uniref:DUF7275 domain-containing protein n=1 Tax=Pseudomonas fluorescens TaxID=294 RepID=UPI002B1E7A32
SHTHRPLNFTKNINDLSVLKQVIKESNSFETPYGLDPFYIDRVRLTKEKFGDKTPSLNKSNKEFFDDFVTKYFDHDDLHKLVAYKT